MQSAVSNLFIFSSGLHLIILFPNIVAKGNSYNLMKMTAKRRRSKRQIQEDKHNAEQLKLETEQKLAQFEQMQREIHEHRQKAAGVRQIEQQVNNLLEAGMVKLDEDGQVQAVSGLDEQQYIL